MASENDHTLYSILSSVHKHIFYSIKVNAEADNKIVVDDAWANVKHDVETKWGKKLFLKNPRPTLPVSVRTEISHWESRISR